MVAGLVIADMLKHMKNSCCISDQLSEQSGPFSTTLPHLVVIKPKWHAEMFSLKKEL